MKAILVTGVDDKTKFESYDVRVWLYNKTTGLDKLYQNVQLKPMPQVNKKRLKQLRKWGWGVTDIECYETGHDDCLDEILGD